MLLSVLWANGRHQYPQQDLQVKDVEAWHHDMDTDQLLHACMCDTLMQLPVL